MSDFKAEILTEIKKMFQSENRNNDGSDTLASHRVDDTISLAPSSTMSYREDLSKNLSTSGGNDHQRDLQADLDSLLTPSKKQRLEEENEPKLDLEKELFEKIDQTYTEDERPSINTNLATRIDKYWSEHSTNSKARKAVYEKYPVPKNCEQLNKPLLDKELLKMNSFTPYHRRVDTELSDIQNVLVKTTSVIAQLADTVLLADEESRVVPAGEIISPLLESVILLGYAHNKVTSKRKSNIRATLHKDIRTVCDKTVPGQNLFGDDWGKAVKDAKQVAQLAKYCENTSSFNKTYVGRWNDVEKPSFNNLRLRKPYQRHGERQQHPQKHFLSKSK